MPADLAVSSVEHAFVSTVPVLWNARGMMCSTLLPAKQEATVEDTGSEMSTPKDAFTQPLSKRKERNKKRRSARGGAITTL